MLFEHTLIAFSWTLRSLFFSLSYENIIEYSLVGFTNDLEVDDSFLDIRF